MFSALAWLRAFFAIALLTTHTNARETSLFTTSVTYCNPPESLLISRFEVAYFPSNSSIAFNVSAASVQPDVNVTANIFLNVYGMRPLNVTVELCNIFGGALCPLPMYNFTGADSLILPDSLGINGRIPGIALNIPDLEGFAQLTLSDVNTGAVRACVQATLGNGWSARQKAVEWTMGGVAIAAALVSFGVSLFFADAIAPFRFFDLMALFQTIASSALLSLNYPSVYRAYALNFAWALGLFPTSDSSAIQNSISSMRHRTGGRLADAAQGGAVQFVNRRLSPYNTDVAIARRSAPIAEFVKREFSHLVTRQTRQTIQGEVQTVTNDSVNVLEAGLPIYVNSLHVATGNAFMTVFICALMLFAIGLAILALGYAVYLVLRKRGKVPDTSFSYLAFSRAWILRLSLIVLSPILIFAFYQWTLDDSWASILLSVLALVALILILGWSTFTTVRIVRQRSEFELFTPDNTHLQANGPLYAQYRVARWWFFALTLLAMVLRAVFIAFVKSQGQAQLGLFVTVEALLVIAHVALKPYPSSGGDVFSTYLAISRLVAMGLMIAFLQNLDVAPIPRVVIGFVIIVVYSIAILMTIFNFILNLFSLLAPKFLRNRKSGSGGSWSPWSLAGGASPGSRSDHSILEKGEGGGSSSSAASAEDSMSEVGRGVDRPTNPTPHQSTPSGAGVLAPFPVSPTGTTVTTMDPPSPYTYSSSAAGESGGRRTSASMTVGSLVPSRWSFSWSQPNSPAGSSVAHGARTGTAEEFSGSGSPGYTMSEGYLSRRTSDSMGHVYGGSSSQGGHTTGSDSAPSAWRPGSSGGSSASHGGQGSGRLVRMSSAKALQGYQQNHERIPEDAAP